MVFKSLYKCIYFLNSSTTTIRRIPCILFQINVAEMCDIYTGSNNTYL